MSAFVLWKRLTENDFNAMHGLASPHGHGGGARHIALGVCNNSFPIDAFLKSRRRTATITTAGQLGNHPAGALIFSSNPDRRGGEWLIRDQFSNRHPAWTSLAGFPTSYDPVDPPYVLVFRVGDTIHVRSALASVLATLPANALPTGLLSRPKGIQPASNAFLIGFDVPQETLVEAYDAAAAEHVSDAFDPKSVADGRKRTLVSLLQRQGQQDFRRKLLSAYDTQCAITRCRAVWVLEAAHITPYRGIRTNVVSNGLLLRADIHTLFDLALIAIVPSTMTIQVSHRVADSSYVLLDGTTPALPDRESLRPSRAAIEQHYRQFQP